MVSSAPDGTVLETERLILRHLTFDDLDVLARMYSDVEVRRFFPEGTLDLEETREELAWIIEVDYARYGYGLWATIERSSGEMIGRCGLLPFKVVSPHAPGNLALNDADERPRPEDHYEIEVAYLLARHRWGRGFATEAARAIVDFGFTRCGADRLICLVDPDNRASAAVARRCGMALDGSVEVDGTTLPLHAITRARWAIARSGGNR